MRSLAATSGTIGYCETAKNISRTFILLAIFLLPYSRFLLNQTLLIAAFFALSYGQWQARWECLKQFKSVFIGIALYLLFVIGVSYSHTSFHLAFSGLMKYNKLIFIPLFLPLFVDQPKWRTGALNIFIISMTISLLLATLQQYHLFNYAQFIHPGKIFPGPNAKTAGMIMNPIAVGILTVFAIFILAQRLINRDKRFWLNILLISFLTFHLLALNGERTSIVSFAAVVYLFCFQHFGIKGLLIGTVAAVVLLGSFYLLSGRFRDKTNDAYYYSQAYQQGQFRNSIGYRIAFIEYSSKIIKAYPLFGAGTGSFTTMYANVHGPTVSPYKTLGEPHNEYIFIATQIGLIGLSVFLLWLFQLWRETRYLPKLERMLAQGLIINFAINGLPAPSLYWNTTGMLFILFICILFASAFAKEKNENCNLTQPI